MGEVFHVDTHFLSNALGVFEDPASFEAGARSGDASVRSGNVARLVDALDLCNLLVLGDRIAFDAAVGGGRQQTMLDLIGRVAARFGDDSVAAEFRALFGGVRPADQSSSDDIQLRAARGATAFFPRLARCATNVLDLFHLPVSTPDEPHEHLLRHVESRRQPGRDEIEAIAAKREITGRRFYAALLSDPTAFEALCDAGQRVQLDDAVLAVLFMNFRLRLAEERSVAREKVFVDSGDRSSSLTDALTYLPSMGRRDFSREFSRFVRWGTDPKTRHGHAFDIGLREYVVEEWERVGCQVHLSERRGIPLVVAAVLGDAAFAQAPARRPERLLEECIRWRRENASAVRAIAEATRAFEELSEEERRDEAASFAADMLRSPSAHAARNRLIGDRLSVADRWMSMGLRAVLNPLGALESVVVDSTDKVRAHFATVASSEYQAATKLSEAARPVLAGVGPDLRQRLIDVFGGTVLDARNPAYDPDRFTTRA